MTGICANSLWMEKALKLRRSPTGGGCNSLQDINVLRSYLDENARGGRRYIKHRSGKEHLQVISCVNFKGGSAKTTSAAHLAQYLALSGYRVLAIDLDLQASFPLCTDINPSSTLARAKLFTA